MSTYEHFMDCPACSSPLQETVDLYDDRYGYPGVFKLAECSGCGHRSLQAHFNRDSLGELYSRYYPRSEYNPEDIKECPSANGFRSWLDGVRRSAYTWVPENVRVLDIGCGFCEALAYHRSRGCDAYGVEADCNIHKVATAFGFNVQIGLFDPDKYPPGFFDYVTMDQVIEHAADPDDMLRGVAAVLKPGGVLIISTPNAHGWGAHLFGRRWINWHAPYHLQFFSRTSMQILAEKAGFLVEHACTLTSSEWLLYQWIHLVSFPAEREFSPFWSSRGKQGALLRLLIRFLHLAHRTSLNHLVTRIFDSMGLGDNFLFVLRKP